MVDCYNRGLLSDARLDEAVKRVLATQEKVLNQPAPVEITEKDLEKNDIYITITPFFQNGKGRKRVFTNISAKKSS